jgi:two-component system sensor histidine kinase DegS
LRRYAQRFRHYCGVPCEVQVNGEPRRLPPKIEISLYRLVQEALQNASAHARPGRTAVTLTFDGQDLIIVVEDDGIGFDLQEVQAHSNGQLGLLGMQERIEALGGRLTIQTGPGQGTSVQVAIPAAPLGQAVDA